MFNLFGRKSKERHPTPSWVKWMLILFVFYAVISNSGRERNPENSRMRQSIEKAGRELNPSNFVDMKSFKGKLFPESSLRVRDISEGKGNPAICGQDVKISYETRLGDNAPVVDSATKEKPLAFRIGEGKAMPALEQGAIGMRVGGKRDVMAKYELTYGSEGHAHKDVPENAMAQFDIVLLETSPTLPDAGLYRIFDTAGGRGDTVSCGDQVKMHITVWSMSGKKIYATPDKDTLIFTPGKSEMFLGLEQGVIGMRVGGARALIVPPAFQKTMHGNAPAVAVPFPKGETVMVDVEISPPNSPRRSF